GGFSQEELLKIWKGLFYCMWMQDKPLLQEELANNISQLIHVIQNTETRHLFIQTFWQTMKREWNGIDNLRLDKFYMLMRMILRQSFEVLKRKEWDESLMELFLQLQMKEVMEADSNAPIGIKFHFIDIYLSELAKVGAKELTADQNLKFIEPFCKIAAKTKDHCVLHAIATGIFEFIVDQSPYAIEDLMKELGSNSDEEDVEEDKQESKEVLKTQEGCLSRKSAQSSEETEDINEDGDDSIGAVLQFDYKAVADQIFQLASRKHTPSLNRKRLYRLFSYLSSSTGIFPQDIPEEVSTDEDDDDEFSRRRRKKKAVKPWEKNKLQKLKEENQDTASAKEASVPHKKREKRKRRPSTDSGPPAGSLEEGGAEAPGSNVFRQGKVPENNKKRKKMNLPVNEAKETTSVATASRENCSMVLISGRAQCRESKKNQLKKKNPEAKEVAVSSVDQKGRRAEGVSPSATALTKPLALEGPKVSRQKAARLDKKRTRAKMLSSAEDSGMLETAVKSSRRGESSTALPSCQKKKAKLGSDFVKFEKSTLPKGVFFRKARSTSSSPRASMQLNKLQSSSSKKVSFRLNKNMTAEFKKTDKSLLVSPEGPSCVAFDPERKPRRGVLKSPPGEARKKKPLTVAAKKTSSARDFL
ncbi:RRP1B protein, partial [Alcedo cyanopectus]|nr:RRP1B protein [Ceyx cyanopectus]